ncbi:MAG: helix-turn-helix domain-containing protein [Chlorobiales bacterium]|nr:helix-turn-helix domain-containing protein [Chlorobiales bacterium]
MTEALSNNFSLELLLRELKTARLEKKLSLDDVSRLSKIKRSYLEEIENGNFRFLPNSYVYAYIKAYSMVVEFGESDALEQCRKELKKSGVLDGRDKVTGSGEKPECLLRKISGSNLPFLKSLFPLTLGMLVGVLGGVGLSYIDDNARVSKTQVPAFNTKPSVSGVDTSIRKKPPIDSSLVTKRKYPKSLL